MGMSWTNQFILIVAGAAVLIGGLLYAYMEYQVRMLRTEAIKLPGGLRFASRFFNVETRQGSQDIQVTAPRGRVLQGPVTTEFSAVAEGAVSVVLPAVGFMCKVTNTVNAAGSPTSLCRVKLTSPDETQLKSLGLPVTPITTVVIDDVPVPVARNFQAIFRQVSLWIERVEQRVKVEAALTEKRRQHAAAAAAFAEATAKDEAERASQPQEDLNVPLSEDERKARAEKQLEVWRAAAGFRGTSSELSIDPRGKVIWFVEVDNKGMVLLHSNKRTFHGSLLGAKITSMTGELEIGVRDAFWTEEDPRLSTFNLFSGSKAETRLAWKERLEILIRTMR